MNITIIGAGNMGRLLASLWKQSGHTIAFGVRDPAQVNVEGYEAKPIKDAVKTADAVVLAVNYWKADEALKNLGNTEGKILIDITNPYVPDTKSPMGFSRVVPAEETASQHITSKHPSDLWVKAFSSLAVKLIAEQHHQMPRIALGFALDEGNILPQVERLITDAGFDPIYIGSLSNAVHLELMGKYAMKTLPKEEFIKL